MQRNHKRNHLGVFGGSGTGKTTYALKYIANAKSTCVFLFDADSEFEDALKLKPARTTAEIDAAILTGWVCFDPHIMFPGELEKAFDYFSDYVLRVCDRLPDRKFFVVDEVGRYCTGHTVPKPFKTLIQTGRRYGIDCVVIGQQPNEVHNTIRVQFSEVCCFQIKDDDESALKYLVKFGFNPEEVRNLDPERHQWICRNNRGEEARG
jgi:hypothetical protein